MRNVACRVGAATETTAKITFISKSSAAPVVTCTGGAVVVGTPSVRYNDGTNVIATTLITITGLASFTQYSYAITQGSDAISGSFRTMPDKTQPFSFIQASCDHPSKSYLQFPYRLIRTLMSDTVAPLVAMFHIDDVSYVDTLQVQDPSGIVTSGKAQVTGLGSDYAVGWAHYYGLVAGQGIGGNGAGSGKTAEADRQYVYQNLPSFLSGGDHAIADNHCRGASVNGVKNADYFGCDKTLEAVALAEWYAFLGDANPEPLEPGKMHWGAEIGCMKFALYDYSLYSEPYDSVLSPDPVGFGALQKEQINTYLSAGDFDFKCLMMESPVTTYGQPWKNWHETEAASWKVTFDANDKLNGVDGNAFLCCGDNHALYAVSYDTFWNFCGGCFNGTNVVNSGQETPGSILNLAAAWGGQNQFSQHGYNYTGDRALGGFWYFSVYPGDRIDAVCYSATGSKLSPVFTMALGSTNNQWTRQRRAFA